MQTEQKHITIQQPKPDLSDKLLDWSLEITGTIIIACLTAYLGHHVRKRKQQDKEK